MRPDHPEPVDGVATLAGGIAHDFNNVLTIVRNCTAFLRLELDQSDPRQQYVDQLVTAAQRMSEVARQLQALSRGQFMRPEHVRPAEIIRRLSDTLRHVLPETVEFRAAVHAPASVVNVDPSQLERAVVGLLMYLADAVADGGRIWLSLTEAQIAESDTVQAGRYVQIVLANSAPKATYADRSRPLEPGMTKRRGTVASDLRVPGARGIIAQAGGYLETDSEPGKGMVFRILFPVVGPEERSPRPSKVVPTERANLRGDEVILVVEDDPGVRRTVCDSLEHYGYTVFEADDGAQALRISALLSSPPDLVLTDVVMPDVNGGELVEALSHERSRARVLLMSGYTDEMRQRSMPADRYPFIPKPFTHEELALRVRQILDSDP